MIATAEKLYGMVKVGAIDCRVEEELCEEFQVFDIPQIKIFSADFSDDGDKYTGKQETNSIAAQAGKKIQSFVQSINKSNIEAFVDRERKNKHHVLLFHDKKSTPMMYKALSKKYRSKLEFGEVRSTEKELCELFGVNVFSTIMVLPNPEEMVGEAYGGEMKID